MKTLKVFTFFLSNIKLYFYKLLIKKIEMIIKKLNKIKKFFSILFLLQKKFLILKYMIINQ